MRALEGGYDPYDALSGARVPAWVRRSPRARQLLIQARKRIPANIAPLLGVKPFVMAKALGCHLAAVARRASVGEGDISDAVRIVKALEASPARSTDGGWGYEFDVQTRWAFYPAGSPNLVATTFIGRGYLEAALVSGREEWMAAARAAAAFLDSAMLRDANGVLAYRYTKDSDRLVHNANLLGAAFVAACAVAGGADVPSHTREAADSSVAALSHLAIWPYGAGAELGWADNFHTAYDLDGLWWLSLTDETSASGALDAGLREWADRFFGPAGEPYYYAGRKGPFDIHSAATAIDVAARIGERHPAMRDLAERVHEWTGGHLVDPSTGRTYYRAGRWGTDRRSFPRWGDAHLDMATAALEVAHMGAACPVERMLKGRSGR